jgi:putative two-component system response regulator
MAGERILTVDDEAPMREIIKRGLEKSGYSVAAASSVAEARRMLAEQGPFVLVLSDINMPGEKGTALMADLVRMAPDTVVVMATAVQELSVAIQALKSGAVDYLLKPFDVETLQVTVQRALERRALELEARGYRDHLEHLVEERTKLLQTRNNELIGTQRALLRSMCQMAEFRDPETGQYLERMARYARLIATRLSQGGPYSRQVNELFVANIFEASPLHDLGNIGVPDVILLKPGRHTDEERKAMQRHVIIGREALRRVKRALPTTIDQSFIDMAIDIAASHHERFDGTGYPAGLAGTGIPLCARIVAVADFYDACSSPRVYRPEPIPHDKVFKGLIEQKGKMFDDVVVDAILAEEQEVLRIRAEMMD